MATSLHRCRSRNMALAPLVGIGLSPSWRMIMALTGNTYNYEVMLTNIITSNEHFPQKHNAIMARNTILNKLFRSLRLFSDE